MPLNFDLPKDRSSIIKVLGVGGGGGNAVNHMYNQGIKGVDFVICNTDMQVLEKSPIPNKIQLGSGLTAGLGAGANPEKGKQAAMEAIEDIIDLLGVNTKMLFITAGMGGGTGTGAAPIIAKAARELDILTVGIVTTPFKLEGAKRKQNADEGIEILKKSVDCLLVINNDKLREVYGKLPMSQSFANADNILTTAAKGIAEIITQTGYINVDFEDVKTVMQRSGVALMGSGFAEGPDRAIEAVKSALNSPLLLDNRITGAKNILLNIASGTDEILLDELDAIMQFVQAEAGEAADVIFGTTYDETLGGKVSVTLIATGFKTAEENRVVVIAPKAKATKHNLYHENNPVAPVIPVAAKDTEEEKMVTHNLMDEQTPAVTEEAPAEKSEENQESIRFELKIQAEDERIAENPVADVSEDDEIRSRVKDVVNKEQAEELTPKMEEFFEEQIQFEITNMKDDEMMSMEEQEKHIEKQIERLKALKNLNLTINSPTGIRDLEKEPAYVRRNKKLNDVPHSSESQVSRLTLFEDPTSNKTTIRTNNSFLHDNVD
ncbi:MAG: cell division protein FtsZ [Bacteroidota bacterium]|jgi:cell division protein FtsZ